MFATGGDGIAAVFGRAVDARAGRCGRAAGDGRGGVAVPMRVRMGVHTGEAEERDGDYLGPAVNRAARLMASADGRQVLVSLATTEVDARPARARPGAGRARGAGAAVAEPTRARLRAGVGCANTTEPRSAGVGPAAAARRRHRGRRARAEAAGRARPPRLGCAPTRSASISSCAALWADEDGGGDRAALQSHVSRLRRHLGATAGRLDSSDAGYRLQLDPAGLDAATGGRPDRAGPQRRWQPIQPPPCAWRVGRGPVARRGRSRSSPPSRR